jgi:hypothetical protein
MEQHKQIIQLSDHVKNRMKSHQLTSFSFSSDELMLSDGTDSLVSTTSQSVFHRRSSTFVTNQVQQPSQSVLFFTDNRINSKQKQLCQECLRRENRIQIEYQRFLDIQKENRKLSEELRSTVLLNQQYQEENFRLKQQLMKVNLHLREYQMNFDLLQQKMILDKNNKPKQDVENEQLRRLRHELQVYSQVIANKRNEEQKQIDYFYQWRKK